MYLEFSIYYQSPGFQLIPIGLQFSEMHFWPSLHREYYYTLFDKSLKKTIENKNNKKISLKNEFIIAHVDIRNKVGHSNITTSV